MKYLILFFLLHFGASSFACNAEVQFIGRAKNVQGCEFQIEYTLYRENQTCPLSAKDFKLTQVGPITKCGVTEGSEVSGVMLIQDGKITLEN